MRLKLKNTDYFIKFSRKYEATGCNLTKNKIFSLGMKKEKPVEPV